MNQNLQSKMNELAEEHFELRAKIFNIDEFDKETIAVESFKLGAKACHDLMLEDIESRKDAYSRLDDINIKLNEQIIELKKDMKKLLAIAILFCPLDNYDHNMQLSINIDSEKEAAKKALQEFEEKYGEINE